VLISHGEDAVVVEGFRDKRGNRLGGGQQKTISAKSLGMRVLEFGGIESSLV
jgi:hypothetical protein